MKSAVKSVTKGSKNVKEKSKITYKGIRGKFKDIQQSFPKSSDSTEIQYYNGNSIMKPRSAPSSPTQPQRRFNKSISGFHDNYRAKASYKRVSQPTSVFRNGSPEDNRRSKSPHSSGDSQKTPSPQEMDLIGEMEDVLKTQLVFSGTNLSPKHTSTSSLNSSLQQETTSTISINSSVISNDPNVNISTSSIETGALFPDPKSYLESVLEQKRISEVLSNGELGSKDSVAENHVGNLKNQANQDLLFLESPTEEEFDPLFVKEIPPPIPTRHQKTFRTESLDSAEIVTPNDKEKGLDHPKKLNPARYLPFNTLQNSSLVLHQVQNPLYNQHHPLSFERVSSSHARSTVNYPITQTCFGHNKPLLLRQPPLSAERSPQLITYKNNNNNNAAAAFAATLLASSTSAPKSSQGQQLFPSLSNPTHYGPTMERLQHKQTHQPTKLSEKDLLGDFSSSFKKLSASHKGKTSDS